MNVLPKSSNIQLDKHRVVDILSSYCTSPPLSIFQASPSSSFETTFDSSQRHLTLCPLVSSPPPSLAPSCVSGQISIQYAPINRHRVVFSISLTRTNHLLNVRVHRMQPTRIRYSLLAQFLLELNRSKYLRCWAFEFRFSSSSLIPIDR